MYKQCKRVVHYYYVAFKKCECSEWEESKVMYPNIDLFLSENPSKEAFLIESTKAVVPRRFTKWWDKDV